MNFADVEPLVEKLSFFSFPFIELLSDFFLPQSNQEKSQFDRVSNDCNKNFLSDSDLSNVKALDCFRPCQP